MLVLFLDLAESCLHVIVVLALHTGRVTAIAEISNLIFKNDKLTFKKKKIKYKNYKNAKLPCGGWWEALYGGAATWRTALAWGSVVH